MRQHSKSSSWKGKNTSSFVCHLDCHLRSPYHKKRIAMFNSEYQEKKSWIEGIGENMVECRRHCKYRKESVPYSPHLISSKIMNHKVNFFKQHNVLNIFSSHWHLLSAFVSSLLYKPQTWTYTRCCSNFPLSKVSKVSFLLYFHLTFLFSS